MVVDNVNIAFLYRSMDLGGQQTATLQIMEALQHAGHQAHWLYQHGDALLAQARLFGGTRKLMLPRYNQWKTGFGRVANRALYYEMAARQIGQYCRAEQIDAVISATTPDSIACNRVVERTGICHLRFVGGSLRQTESHFLERYEELGVDRNVHAYLGWPLTFEELRTANVPEHKFRELPFAVDARRFFPLDDGDRRAKRKEMGFSDDDLVIGWVGRIALNMQLWDTLELVRILHASGRANVKFLVLGGGDDVAELRRRIAQYGLEAHVLITGWRPYAEVNGFINCMDVVPLLESDPQGGSIVREAMAAGRVALSVDGESGTQRWFMPSDATVLVPPDNYLEHAVSAVRNLMDRPEERRRLGQRAREYVQTRLLFSTQASVIVETVAGLTEK